MPTSSATIKALHRLAHMEEYVVNGVVWTKFADTQEYKVSPFGLTGDYDKDCYWVAYADLAEQLGVVE